MHEFFRETSFSLAEHKTLTLDRKPLPRSTILPADDDRELVKRIFPDKRPLPPNPLLYKIKPGILPELQHLHELGAYYAIFRSSYNKILSPHRATVYANLIPEDIIRDFNALRDLSTAMKADMDEFKKLLTPSFLDQTYSFFNHHPVACIAGIVKVFLAFPD